MSNTPPLLVFTSCINGKQGLVEVETEVVTMESVQDKVSTTLPIVCTRLSAGIVKNTVLSVVNIAVRQGFLSSTSKSFVARVSV